MTRQQIEAETEARIIAWLRWQGRITRPRGLINYLRMLRFAARQSGISLFKFYMLIGVARYISPSLIYAANAIERGEHRKDRDEG